MSLYDEQEKILIEKYNQTYQELSPEEKRELHNLYFNAEIRQDLKKKAEKLIFYKKPPTPEEFLDPVNGWVSKDTPESMLPWVRSEFLKILDENNIKQIIVEYGATRCEYGENEVLMFDLSRKKVKDLKIGDILMGDNSKPRKVLRLEKNKGSLYKVKQNKAEDYIVNENHILVLQHTNKGLKKNRNYSPDKNAGKIIEVPVKEYINFSKTRKHILKGIKVPLYFPRKEVVIDPYWLGLWLSDGFRNCTGVTNIDSEIKEYIYSYAEKLNMRVSLRTQKKTEAITYNIVGKNKGDYNLQRILKEHNLIYNKHIPVDYIRNDEETRLELLAGIIDGDGHLQKKSDNITISQKSKKLTEDVVLLSQSLGFRTNYTKIKKKIKSINFEGEYYSINISGNLDRIPTKLKRKQVEKSKTRVNPLRTGISVEYYGEGDYYSFTVDGNNRYLGGDLTVRHNCGKTFLALHLMLYIIVYIHHLREPALFYKLSSITELAIYIISFNYDKTNQLYLSPLFKMMSRSPNFVNVKFQDQVTKKQKEVGYGKIVYSKSATAGEITLASGLQLHTGNDDALAFVGANILCAFVSEIAFWLENAGASEEQIFRLYTDLRGRIKATVGEQYLAFLYLDTSANLKESLIENHIIEELQYKDYVSFNWMNRWTANNKGCPIYNKTKETFKVCTGAGSIPARIIENEEQLKDIPSDLIVDVPIDYYDEFKVNLIKSIKDIIGRPTISENKFIQNVQVIDNIFNNPVLENVEGLLIADASSMPETLLWEQIKNKFFLKDNSVPYDKWIIKRAPYEPRYIGIDNAFSSRGDIMGISVLHKEWSVKRNATVYVIDFCFGVGSADTGINLEAPSYLSLDLINKGTLALYGIASDTFHSEAQKQFLERNNVDFVKQSVDTDINPYQYMLTCLINETLKGGKNIFLKNNLQSLMRLKGKNGKEKIDHTKGQTNNKYLGDWEKSQCGTFAKDVSDAVCQSLWLAFQHDYRPTTIYEEENKKFSKEVEDVTFFKNKAIQSIISAQNMMAIPNKFGL